MNNHIATNEITAMKKLLSLFGMTALCATATFAAPLGTGFTYQGHLKDGGAPATGIYDLVFTLYAHPTDTLYFGEPTVLSAVPVTNGTFTVELNSAGEFGPYAFNGDARWLQIGVRTNCNCLAAWTLLTVEAATVSGLFMTRETVMADTPAERATSSIVVAPRPRRVGFAMTRIAR